MTEKIKVEIKSGNHALRAEASGPESTRRFYRLAIIAMLFVAWLAFALW